MKDYQEGMIWLDLTNGCNLECLHCYADSSPRSKHRDKMEYSDYEKVLFDSYSLGFRRIQFIGGEPFLFKRILELIRIANKLGFSSIEIFSNLTFLPKGIVDSLKEYDASVATSFFSADESTHEEITRKKGSFTKTCKNIRLLIEENINIRVGCIELDINQGHFESARKLLSDLGVRSISLDSARNLGRHSSSLDKECPSSLCGQCAGKTVAIGHDGLVSPCVMSRSWPIGNLRTNTLAEILASDSNFETRNMIWDSVYGKLGIPRNDRNNFLAATSLSLSTPDCNPGCTPAICEPNGYCIPHGYGISKDQSLNQFRP